MLELIFSVHWLTFMFVCKTIGPLQGAVALSRKSGATCFELIYHALNHLNAKDTAYALKTGGINKAVMCIFFPAEGRNEYPMGDPLSEDATLFNQAVATYKQVLTFIVDLRKHGIHIDLIGGPSCWVLGKDYGVDDAELRARILRFFKVLEPDLRAAKVRVAIELLRVEEDRVMQTVQQARAILALLNEQIPGKMFGLHYDTFHFNKRGIAQGEAIRTFGQDIFHLHLNGEDRRPPGSEDETIDWKNDIVPALVDAKLSGLAASYEPFCDVVRDACPPLGVGLPDPYSEPEGIEKTYETLSTSGITFIEAI